MWCFLVDVVSARMKPKPTAAKAGKLHDISILDTSRAGLAMWWKLTWRGTESQKPIQLAIFIFTAACGVSSILISKKPYWRVIPYSSPIFYYNGWLNSHWRSPARTSAMTVETMAGPPNGSLQGFRLCHLRLRVDPADFAGGWGIPHLNASLGWFRDHSVIHFKEPPVFHTYVYIYIFI